MKFMRNVFLISLMLFNFVQASELNTSKYDECRFSVVIPNMWNTVQLPTSENSCELKIKNDSTKAEIQVSLANEFLYEAYDLGFDFFNGEWIATGRQGSYEKAEVVQVGVWAGLKGVIYSGCHDKKGFQGLCPHFSMLLREREVVDGTNIKITALNVSDEDIMKFVSLIEPVF